MRYWAEDSVTLPVTVHSYLKRMLPEERLSTPDSTLDLAVSAVSFAVFGQTKAVSAALSLGWGKYVKAIAKTRLAVVDPSQAVTDHFLLTVTLLSNFEVRCISTSNPVSLPLFLASD
jgi:hypothetical protein